MLSIPWGLPSCDWPTEPSHPPTKPRNPARDPDGAAFAQVVSGLNPSALEGVPAEFEALGLELLKVRQSTSERESPRSGDSGSPRRTLPSGPPDP